MVGCEGGAVEVEVAGPVGEKGAALEADNQVLHAGFGAGAQNGVEEIGSASIQRRSRAVAGVSSKLIGRSYRDSYVDPRIVHRRRSAFGGNGKGGRSGAAFAFAAPEPVQGGVRIFVRITVWIGHSNIRVKCPVILDAEIGAALFAFDRQAGTEEVICRPCKSGDAGVGQFLLVVTHVILHVKFQAASQSPRQASIQEMLQCIRIAEVEPIGGHVIDGIENNAGPPSCRQSKIDPMVRCSGRVSRAVTIKDVWIDAFINCNVKYLRLCLSE